jgi:hypothetical protein
MLRYLGIIEERTNELLTAQATINAKVKKRRNLFSERNIRSFFYLI